jgi:hypothetical protein
MATALRRTSNPFDMIGRNPADAAWNGSPITLQVGENVNMSQTPNGSMVLAYLNQATQNNLGTMAATSGGSKPDFLSAPALAAQPSIWMNNWRANNLRLSNISAHEETPIWVAALGPGIPGQFSVQLPANGVPVPLAPVQSAQGRALPQWMQLVLQCNSADLTVFCVIGGPQQESGNNGYAIILNAASNTPPPGYYAVTTGNNYTFQFNWGSSLVYVANMSPGSSSGASAALRLL